jgi:SAM-dependent methyltransferase
MATITQQDAPAAACAWCGAALGEGARRGGGTAACARCGSATTDPWPSETTLERAYAAWYRPAGGRFSGVGDQLLRRSRGALARRLDALAPPGTVLDVGAGDGFLLDALTRRGREAIGLERGSSRPDVREQDISELAPPGGPGSAELVRDGFAAIVFWHSLEHLRAPGHAIAHAAALLKPGGVLVVAVPNAASLQARVFGERWFALDLPRHLVHLPASALVSRVEQLGLRVDRVSYVRGGQVLFGWLHGLTGLLPGRPSLYEAIRRPQARAAPMSPARRGGTLTAAVLLLPLAAAGAGLEVALRRGGTVYVEAVRG